MPFDAGCVVGANHPRDAENHFLLYPACTARADLTRSPLRDAPPFFGPRFRSAMKVTIWRAYRLHGTALKDMKERLREWEASLGDEQHKSSSTSSSLEYA